MFAGFTGSLPFFVVLDGFCLRGSLEVVAGLIVLPGVSLALAGCDHSYFVGSYTSILALQLDPLSASFVIDTSPLLRAPPAPVLGSVTSSNPVGQQWQREAFSSTHQFFQGVNAGALAIWDVLGGSQLSTTNLNAICRMHRARNTEIQNGVISLTSHFHINQVCFTEVKAGCNLYRTSFYCCVPQHKGLRCWWYLWIIPQHKEILMTCTPAVVVEEAILFSVLLLRDIPFRREKMPQGKKCFLLVLSLGNLLCDVYNNYVGSLARGKTLLWKQLKCF